MSDEENKKDVEDWEDLSWVEQAYDFGYAKYYSMEIEADREVGLDLLKQAADLESTDAILALIHIYEDECSEDFDEASSASSKRRSRSCGRYIPCAVKNQASRTSAPLRC